MTATASPAHVQALLDQAVAELEQTTKSGAAMVSRYGADPARWPAGHWVNGLNLVAGAREEAGHLVSPPPTFTVGISGTPRVGQTLHAVTA